MKKILCAVMIALVIFNFIVCIPGFAETDGTSSPMTDSLLGMDGNENTTADYSNGVGAQIIEEGVVSQKKGQPANMPTTSDLGGQSIIGLVMGSIALIADAIPLQIQLILSAATITPTTDGAGEGGLGFWISIERIVFNEISIFNANYFDNDADYTVGVEGKSLTITNSAASTHIKASVTEMYTVCRILALSISLLVLIYIGIRMAFSSVAEAEAKYKKMLVGWVESIVLLFLLVYIMVGVFGFGELLLNLFYSIKCDIIAGGAQSFEETILWSFLYGILKASGITLAVYSIMYWILVFNQLKFCYIYMRRLLTIGFLIMIAPLITVTYPIDKASDGKAQAFGKWFKEYLINVLIQPLHALIYLVFMFSASEIAAYAPLVALLFLTSLSRAEDIVKKLLNINATSVKGIKETFKKGEE